MGNYNPYSSNLIFGQCLVEQLNKIKNDKSLIEMEHIKNIIQKNLLNAIKDKINEREKLITEMWSYSDQMDNTMDYVYDKI